MYTHGSQLFVVLMVNYLKKEKKKVKQNKIKHRSSRPNEHGLNHVR